MNKKDLLSLFKVNSQKWLILKHILANGKITNYEASCYALNYTGRISEIRRNLNIFGYTIKCTFFDGRKTTIYTIEETE